MAQNTANYKKIQKINGWLSHTDFSLLSVLISAQTGEKIEKSAVVEIGVHHGKSFIVLALSAPESLCYAIDLFSNQTLNRDGSGCGDKEKFLENISKNKIDINRVIIDERKSGDVDSNDILSAVGEARVFHIDGAHYYEAVKADISLAIKVLHYQGILVIDDVFRPEWPDVSAAVFSSSNLSEHGWVCFAIGFNKSYFCKKEHVNFYHNALTQSSILSPLFSKRYETSQNQILIYQRYPLPEWGLRKLMLWILSVYYPRLHAFLYIFKKSRN